MPLPFGLNTRGYKLNYSCLLRSTLLVLFTQAIVYTPAAEEAAAEEAATVALAFGTWPCLLVYTKCSPH
jgi:hypothetical protein